MALIDANVVKSENAVALCHPEHSSARFREPRRMCGVLMESCPARREIEESAQVRNPKPACAVQQEAVGADSGETLVLADVMPSSSIESPGAQRCSDPNGSIATLPEGIDRCQRKALVASVGDDPSVDEKCGAVGNEADPQTAVGSRKYGGDGARGQFLVERAIVFEADAVEAHEARLRGKPKIAISSLSDLSNPARCALADNP